VASVAVKNLLVVSSQVPDDVVAAIAQVLFEQKDALVAAHPEARHLAIPTSFDDTPAPYHAGAIRYYTERR
jgi:hypothetical protein